MIDDECERAMLATVWLAGDFLMLLRLDAQDFCDPFHQWLYGHLRALVEADEPLDMVALLRRLKAPGAFEGRTPAEVEGHRAMIAELLTAWAPPTHAEFYFRVLRTERMRRAAGRLADAIRKRIEDRADPAAVLAWAGEQIDRLLTKAPVRRDTGIDANGAEAPDAAKAKAQPATASSIPAAARNSNGSAERERAGVAKQVTAAG